MPSFSLSLQFTIKGIGAASGIVSLGSNLFLISDSSDLLYRYDTSQKTLTTIELSPGGGQNIAKKLKPDFEALAYHDDKLYLFGSGSTDKRNTLAVVDPVTSAIAKYDLSNLYSKMKAAAHIGGDDLNIEGVVFAHQWYFFQRGNGPAAQNGIFTVDGNIFTGDARVTYKEFPVVKCNGVAATFTDAVIVGDKIWFLATAEDSKSVYDDGQILGTVIGSIDIATMGTVSTEKISDTHKFEGIAFSHRTGNEIVFLLCEDNDTEALESGIYKLSIRNNL